MKKTELEEMHRAYQKELHEQTHPLERWYRQQDLKKETPLEMDMQEKPEKTPERETPRETERKMQNDPENVAKRDMQGNSGNTTQQLSAKTEFAGNSEEVQYLLFCSQNGILRPDAEITIQSYFAQHPQCLCVYADEDEIVRGEKLLQSSGLTEEFIENQNTVSGQTAVSEEEQMVNTGQAKPRGVTKSLGDEKEKQIISSDGCAVIDGKNVCNPWLKPDWSPDTFRSFFYFGNIFALRICPQLQAMSQELVGLLDIRIEENGIIRFSDVQREQLWKLFRKYMPVWSKRAAMVGHCDEVLFHYEGSRSWEENLCFEYAKPERDITVSIIIPSKDHPKLLQQCLWSISKSGCGIPAYEISTHGKEQNLLYEILVVDNGSSEENQKEIERLRQTVHFTYIYEPMEFNFSRMCNLGAAKAAGDVLLFLNDDITVQGENWLKIMAFQALCPETGAVGAKLYYPDSRIIQHVGITNMKVGPAHKLGGSLDEGNLYHMRSKAVYNVIAVTAAALAVEKEKFDRVGGFLEQLAVAYNDVELGFKLFEAGYYNVQRNDVILYHHESVSRGVDDSPEKEKRLLNERRLLYHLHPGLNGRDPFYHPLLVQKRLDADFHVDVIYDYEEKISEMVEIIGVRKTKVSVIRKLLRKGPEMLMNVDRIYTEEDNLCMEGWGSLTDKSLPGFQRRLLLIGEKQFSIGVFPKYRPDTRQVLAAQPYYELSGFVARIPKSRLPEDCYRIGMEMKPGKVILSEKVVSLCGEPVS